MIWSHRGIFHFYGTRRYKQQPDYTGHTRNTDTMEQAYPVTVPVPPKNGGAAPAVPEKRTLRYKAGDLIIKQGDFGTALYRITSGAVSIFKELHGEDVLLYELGPGDVFGEMVFIDGGTGPRTASAVAKNAVELEAWHYLALQRERQAMSPIIRLMAMDMVKKLGRISAVYDRLRIEKHSTENRPALPAREEVNLTAHEPSCTFKLAGSETVGKEWEGQVDYRLPDNPTPDVLHATGVDIDSKGMRFDVTLGNMNHGGHEPGSRVDMMLHLPGGAPVIVLGEITSISRGSLIGHTALRVQFHNLSIDARLKIEALLKL